MGRIAFVVLGVIAITLSFAGCRLSSDSQLPLRHEMYIWQRAWTPQVSESVRAATELTAAWHVLVAQSNTIGEWREFSVDTNALAQSKRRLVAVFRIDGQRRLLDGALIAIQIRAWHALHGSEGWQEIEIDYDCPTNALPIYAKFLRTLRTELPASVPISLTVLPAWIRSPDLGEVVDQANRTVLQVHSVLDPKRGLFSKELAAQWIVEYSKITSRPFDVALPDYGSKIAFDSRGRVLAVTSEAESMLEGKNETELEANPKEVQQLLKALTVSRPSNLAGMIWFRMPVKGDRRIWSLNTLAAVINNQTLSPKLSVAAIADSQGALQLALSNTGNVDTPLPRKISLLKPCLAADGQGAYTLTREPDRLVYELRARHMLRIGQSATVGWTRCAVTQEEIQVES